MKAYSSLKIQIRWHCSYLYRESLFSARLPSPKLHTGNSMRPVLCPEPHSVTSGKGLAQVLCQAGDKRIMILNNKGCCVKLYSVPQFITLDTSLAKVFLLLGCWFHFWGVWNEGQHEKE